MKRRTRAQLSPTEVGVGLTCRCSVNAASEAFPDMLHSCRAQSRSNAQPYLASKLRRRVPQWEDSAGQGQRLGPEVHKREASSEVDGVP